MKTLRFTLYTLMTIALFGVTLLAEEVSGPVRAGQLIKHGPVGVGAYAAPSPRPSVLTQGMADWLTTDGLGRLWTRIVSSASDPVVVVGPLPAGSPIGSLASLPVMLPSKAYYSGSASSATDIIASTDASQYASATVQLTGTWSATIKPQISNDNSNWSDLQVHSSVGGTQQFISSSISANGIYEVPLNGRYFRVTCSSYSSGTMVVNASLNTHPLAGYIRHAIPNIGLNAHDAVMSGAPVALGMRAQNTLPSAVSADNDVCYMVGTQQGQVRTIIDDAAGTVGVGHSVKYEASHAGGATEVTTASSATLLKWVQISNPNTTDVWLQLHNATNPNVGTDIPLMAIPIPGGVGASNRAIFNQEFGPVGITFSTALTYTITTTAGGSTAPASACSVAMGYK